MGLLDRVRAQVPPNVATAVRRPAGSGADLLASARRQHDRAEREMDREPETKATLERAYLHAAEALAAEGSPARAEAWLGLAEVRRYQKGRREDTLQAYDAALTAAPEDRNIWIAYLDYVTYGISAVYLLEIVRRIPASVRPAVMPQIVAVGRGRDRWATMPEPEQERFQAELLPLLEVLDDKQSLGAMYSEQGLAEHRTGSHDVARATLRRAVETGHPTLGCVDRLTIDLVKLGEHAEAHALLTAALSGPIPSDSLRDRLTKRLAKCEKQAARAGAAEPARDEPDEPPAESTAPVRRSLVRGENAPVSSCAWRAQVGWHDPSGQVDVDVCALLLGADGRVADDSAMVFYNQLSSPDGSVRHGGEQTLGSADLCEELHVDLPTVPSAVARIVVAASVDTGTFADVQRLHVLLEGDEHLVFEVPDLTSERAVVVFELYRRQGAWKARAVGQGYADGLAGLARDFGVDVN